MKDEKEGRQRVGTGERKGNKKKREKEVLVAYRKDVRGTEVSREGEMVNVMVVREGGRRTR